MKLAEELYQAGSISYPRTETDVYDPGMDLRVSQHGFAAHSNRVEDNGAVPATPRLAPPAFFTCGSCMIQPTSSAAANVV